MVASNFDMTEATAEATESAAGSWVGVGSNPSLLQRIVTSTTVVRCMTVILYSAWPFSVRASIELCHVTIDLLLGTLTKAVDHRDNPITVVVVALEHLEALQKGIVNLIIR